MMLCLVLLALDGLEYTMSSFPYSKFSMAFKRYIVLRSIGAFSISHETYFFCTRDQCMMAEKLITCDFESLENPEFLDIKEKASHETYFFCTRDSTKLFNRTSRTKINTIPAFNVLSTGSVSSCPNILLMN